jgi:hypothetical protein
MTDIRHILMNMSSSLGIFVPAVIKLSAGQYNLWDGSQSTNTTLRESYFRENLAKEVCVIDKNPAVMCMVTGTVDRTAFHGSNKIVLCAHIIPNSAKLAKNVEKLQRLGYTTKDVDSTRNALFLLSGIEQAFDQLYVYICIYIHIYAYFFIYIYLSYFHFYPQLLS